VSLAAFLTPRRSLAATGVLQSAYGVAGAVRHHGHRDDEESSNARHGDHRGDLLQPTAFRENDAIECFQAL